MLKVLLFVKGGMVLVA